MMTNILSFSDAPRVVSGNTRQLPRKPCEVVIFPGVRFERRETFESPLTGGTPKQAGKQ